MFQCMLKLKRIKGELKKLNRTEFSHIQQREEDAKKNLDDAQNILKKDPLNTSLQEEEKRCREKYMVFRKAYLSFLYQKAHLSWMKEGDGNTRLFHTYIKRRRRENGIFSVLNEKGERVTDEEKIQEVFINFYKNHMGYRMERRLGINKKIMKRGPVVDMVQQRHLVDRYQQEEVRGVFMEIPGSKAPGPDGFSSSFFQDCREVVGEKLSEAVCSCLNAGKLLKQVNSTAALQKKKEF